MIKQLTFRPMAIERLVVHEHCEIVPRMTVWD